MALMILGGRVEESTRKCEYYGEFLKQLSQDHPGFKKDFNLPNSQLTWLCPQPQLTSNRNWVKVSPSTLESAWCHIVQINIYITTIESFNSWSVSCARLAIMKEVWWLEWSCPIFSEEERGYRYKMFTPVMKFKGNTINCILGGLHIWYKKVEQLQPEPAEATARETEEFSHRKHLPGQLRSLSLSFKRVSNVSDCFNIVHFSSLTPSTHHLDSNNWIVDSWPTLLLPQLLTFSTAFRWRSLEKPSLLTLPFREAII